MKPKYLLKIVVASIAVALIAGCSQVLDTPSYGFYNESEILKTETDANGLLLGAYSEMTKRNWNLFHNCYWIVIDFDNDHVVGPNWAMGTIGSGAFQGFWGMDRVWSGLFSIVNRCNQVLEKVPAMSIDETVKNNVLGEAQALRAWAYFTLVRMYGELPLRPKSMEADPAVKVPRSPIGEVYKFIVSDLKTAIPKLLPKGHPKGGGVGRLNKPAAHAILAHVYLTMASGNQKGVSISVRGGKETDNTAKKYTQSGVAGYETFDSQEYFKKSRAASDSIIKGNSGGSFDLAPYPDVFSKAQINGTEALWYLQFKAGTDVINNMSLWYNTTDPKLGYGGWVWVSNNFYDSFEETDLRALKGIKHQFIADGPAPYFYPQRDAAKYAWTWNDMPARYLNRAFLTKYFDVSNSALQETDGSFFLERFANVLLMFAEAENEVNGPTAAAYDALNRVRRRSKASEAPPAMTQEEFRSFVLEERGKELAQECTRKFDLLRRDIYLQVMNAIAIDQENNVKSRSKKHLLYPIPQSDIDASNKAVVQNPGW